MGPIDIIVVFADEQFVQKTWTIGILVSEQVRDIRRVICPKPTKPPKQDCQFVADSIMEKHVKRLVPVTSRLLGLVEEDEEQDGEEDEKQSGAEEDRAAGEEENANKRDDANKRDANKRDDANKENKNTIHSVVVLV